MKEIAAIVFALVLGFGLICCNKNTCTNDTPHDWGKWEDAWPHENSCGYMLQRRHCQKCGLIQLDSHN